MDVYLEVGPKKTFACATDWPGYCRSGKSPDEALAALVEYGSRYAAAIGPTSGFEPPSAVTELSVVQRLKGGSGTDFGIPSAAAKADQRPIDDGELQRLKRILSAAWEAFDASAARAKGRELQKGPRGGGRDRPKIVKHVLEAEAAYAKQIGVPAREADARDVPAGDQMAAIRAVALSAMAERARGVPPPDNPRRTSPYWSVRYFVRRSAWHALDHAWEIEDRVL